MKKIALFGTSADPPTTGHQEILKWLSQHFDFVAVWAADNPFKYHTATLSHRAAMLQLLIEEININSPKHNISLEQELSSSRTLETVEKAKSRWGEKADFTLVIGSDLLNQLPLWYRIEELLREVKLLVIPRPGYVIDKTSLEALQKLGGKIFIAELTGLDISSTAYRESGDTQALPEPVVAYIQQQHLYVECQEETTKKLQIR